MGVVRESTQRGVSLARSWLWGHTETIIVLSVVRLIVTSRGCERRRAPATYMHIVAFNLGGGARLLLGI